MNRHIWGVVPRRQEGKEKMESTVFDNVWYRSVPNRGRARTLLAFQDRGVLIVSDTHFEFRGKKTDKQIPISQIESISYGKQGADWFNKWVTIIFDGGERA